MRWLGFILLVSAACAQEPRPGIVQFSNGETLEGQVSLTPGAELKMVDGTTLTSLAFDKVQEIRCAPEEETLEQKWRFPVAGQTRKEKWGQPYPIRHLRATVTLAGGKTVAGHLYTTVLYVEGGEKNEKVILAAKQRGQEGETLASLVYPASVRFTSAAVPLPKPVRLEVGLPGEVVALTRGALVRLEGQGDPTGVALFVAVRDAKGITVGWPVERDALLLAVQTALKDVRDFFDNLKLIGVWRDPASGDVFSLMMCERLGATTLDEAKSQPWRCEVWRWKFEEEEKRFLLAGRGYFFRGILARGERAPAITMSAKLWNLKRVGDAWTVEGQ